MGILSTALLILMLVILLDSLVRAILLLQLGRSINAKGDYRTRDHEFGKAGNKHFVINLLGASSIYGEGSIVGVPFADSLVQELVMRGHKVTTHNLAVSGHKVSNVTNMQVPRMKPSDLVLVYAGTKDCLTLAPARRYLADLRKLLKALHGQTVIWITIGDPRLLWLFPVWLRWLFYFRAKLFTRLLIQELAEHPMERWRVLDFFSAGMTEARRRNLTVRQIVADGIHLSDDGQQLIGEMVSKEAQSLV